MADPVMRLGWGSGYENSIDLGYPLDRSRFGRRPRANSRYGRTPTGIPDALITGWDFTMAGDIRWVPRTPNPSHLPTQTPWSGPTGVGAFLAWCAENSFRLYPDVTGAPACYVDGCVLLSPAFDAGEPTSLEDSDGTFLLPVVVGHATVDLGLLARGILFEFVPGARASDPPGYTFSRAATGKYHGRSGVAEAAAGVIRDRHFVGSERGALFEDTETNLALRSEEMDNPAWAKGASSVVTPDVALAPNGTMTADFFGEDTTASVTHGASEVITITAGQSVSFSVYAKQSVGARRLRLYCDSDAAANRFRARFDLDLGTVTAESNVGTGALKLSRITPVPGWPGWYRCMIGGTVDAAATSVAIRVVMLDASNSEVYSGDGASGFLVWGMHARAGAPFCGAYIATAGATVSRGAADQLDIPITLPSTLDWSMLVEFHAHHGAASDWPDTDDPLLLSLHTSASSPNDTDLGGTILLHRQNASAQYEWEYQVNRASAPRTFTVTDAAQTLVVRHSATDGHQLSIAIDGGAFVVGGGGGPITSETLLSNILNGWQLLRLRSHGNWTVFRVRGAVGLKTLSELQAL